MMRMYSGQYRADTVLIAIDHYLTALLAVLPADSRRDQVLQAVINQSISFEADSDGNCTIYLNDS